MTAKRSVPTNKSIRLPEIREMKLQDCSPGDLVRWMDGDRIIDGIIGEDEDDMRTTFVALRGMKENDFTVRRLSDVRGKFLNFGTNFIIAADPARMAMTLSADFEMLKGPIVFDNGSWLLQVAASTSGQNHMRWLNLNGGSFRGVDENPVRCLKWRIDLTNAVDYPPFNFMNVDIKRPEPRSTND